MAFGCAVVRVDGHDFAALDEALHGFPYAYHRPGVLIADTVRGRGVPSLMGRADRWFCNFTREEVTDLLAELHGEYRAELISAPVMVR